jgi:hypothetical protein
MRPDTRRPEGWISPCRDANLRALATVQVSATPESGGTAPEEAVREEQRPFWVKAFDVASVSALVVLLALATARLLHALGDGGAWWLLAPAAVAAVLAADFVSGLVHWTCDRFFAEDTPLIGRMLIQPFREHHVDPLAITRHGLFELCGNNALAVLLPVLGLVLTGAPRASAASIAGHAFVIAFALAVFATNQLHKWAHARQRSAAVRFLQRTGVILSPEVHARHHRGYFSHGYCVTTGWLNPLLDRYRVLPRCEAWLRTLDPGTSPLRSRRAS